MTDLAGKVAIVTGGTAGIGRAAAERLLARGARVVLTGRDPARAAALQPLIDGGTALFVAHDAGDEAGWANLVGQTVARFGRLDILVNNAGRIIVKPLPALTLDDMRAMLRANLDAAFLGMRAAWPHLSARGGSIVNVSAGMGDRTGPIGLAYSGAKGALQALTRAAALEGAARGIRANAILPGVIWSDGWKRMAGERPEETKAGLAPGIPMLRVGEPAEVAAAIAFLAGDGARYITGVEFGVDGGKSAG